MANHYRFGVDCSGERRNAFREVLKDERKELRGYRVSSIEAPTQPVIEPEFYSIQAFVSYMKDEVDDNGNVPLFTSEQANKLSAQLKMNLSEVNERLRIAGLTSASRVPKIEPRGYRSPENKWASNPSYGGSGKEQILGFSGSKSSGRSPELGVKPRTVLISSRKIPIDNKPRGLTKVNPELDRKRLKAIKEIVLQQEKEQQLKQEKIKENEQKIRTIIRREKVLFRIMQEAENIRNFTGTLQIKIEKCIRFIKMVDLFKNCYSSKDLEVVFEDVKNIKDLFQTLI